MSLHDRGRLKALICYLGVSQAEAAEIIGISEQTLSRKLAGKERYDISEQDIARLEAVATSLERMEDAAVAHIEAALAAAPPEALEGTFGPVRLLVYRHDSDLPPWTDLPYASMNAAVMARVERRVRRGEPGPLQIRPANLIMFDRAAYSLWLDGREDAQEARAEWAALQPLSRLGLKIDTSSIGWAQIAEEREPPVSSKSRGTVKF